MRPSERVGITDDPLWLIAFPIYYAVMWLYGAWAVVYYLPSIRLVAGDQPTGAQLFGALIVAACTVGILGSIFASLRGGWRLELIGHVSVVALMAFYFASLCYLVVFVSDESTRPGSIFVPLVFAVFPAIRVAVIWRRYIGRR